MPARSLCQKFLKNILATLHFYHQKSLIDATNAVINGASLTLSSIGRHLTRQHYPRRKKGGLRHFENRWEMRYQMEIEQISEKP